jgi:hypothetical protein
MSDTPFTLTNQRQLIAAGDSHAPERRGSADSELFRATLDLRWVRLPVPGARCEWSGLSRTGINALILPSQENKFRPPVLSASLRKPGQRRATRLINLASLLRYLQEQAVTIPAAETATEKALKKGKNK